MADGRPRWSVTGQTASTWEVFRDGAWYADASDLDDAVGVIQGARYRGAVIVTEPDGYTYERLV